MEPARPFEETPARLLVRAMVSRLINENPPSLPPSHWHAKEALARIARGESPTPEDLAQAPQLDFWCIVVEEPFAVLQGVVTGHPLLGEGHMIATRPLLWMSEDRTAARTVSRWYRLGMPLAEARGSRGSAAVRYGQPYLKRPDYGLNISQGVRSPNGSCDARRTRASE